MNVFYSENIVDNKVFLKEQEARHCHKVLRKGRGESIDIIDGKGFRYSGIIDEVRRNEVLVNIVSREYFERAKGLPHIAFGLIKNSTRLEWMIEKLTEIGVRSITPVICSRSERKKVNLDRIQKVLISATKQSLGLYVPEFHAPVGFRDFCNQAENHGKFIASHGEGVEELASVAVDIDEPLILIGPEGDFTDGEIDIATELGFKRVNLGKRRLRVETAAIVANTLLVQR